MNKTIKKFTVDLPAAFSTSSIKLKFVSTCRLLHGVLSSISSKYPGPTIHLPLNKTSTSVPSQHDRQSERQRLPECVTPPDLKRAAQHVECTRTSWKSSVQKPERVTQHEAKRVGTIQRKML